MKTYYLTPMISALVLLTSCSEGDKQSQTQAPDKSHLQAAVGFNDGAKWKSDAATNQGIEALRLRVVESINKIDAAAIPQLVTELEKGHAQVLQNTTMKDKAHQQFEVFMHSIKKTIDSLKTVDAKATKDVLINLDNQLKTYSAYFE